MLWVDLPGGVAVTARARLGKPSFVHVQGVADAIMAALSRGVDLVVPKAMFDEIRSAFPPDLPPYIKVR